MLLKLIYRLIDSLRHWVKLMMIVSSHRTSAPPMDKANKGADVEDIVEQICKTAFLEDFVVRSPKFRKSNGQLKEVADILIPFGDTLLAIQIKSRTETRGGDQKTVIDFGRIEKTVEEGIAQLKTIRRLFNSPKIDYCLLVSTPCLGS